MNACRSLENWQMALALLRAFDAKHLQTDTVAGHVPFGAIFIDSW
jgi:hypothetical protein